MKIVHTCYLMAEIIHNPLIEGPPVVKCVYTRSDPSSCYKSSDIREANILLVTIFTSTSEISYQDASDQITKMIDLKFCPFPKWIKDYWYTGHQDFQDFCKTKNLEKESKMRVTRPIFSQGGSYIPEDHPEMFY